MYADHYAVPEGLNIKLIGAVRWRTTSEGHWVVSLWRTPDRRAYYCQEVWRPWSVPFWMGTAMSDLVECTVPEFEAYTNHIEAMLGPDEEGESAHHRLQELFMLWGFVDGTDRAIDEAVERGRFE